MQEESCYFINSPYHSTISSSLDKCDEVFFLWVIEYQLQLHFLKVKMGLLVDISLSLESSMNPKAPSLLTVPLPSLTFPPSCLGHRTPCKPTVGISPWPSSTSAALQLHTALPCLPVGPRSSPMPRAGAALESPSYPLLAGGGRSPGTRLSLGPHSALTVALCVLPYKAFSMNPYCLSFFLKYYVAQNAKHMII